MRGWIAVVLVAGCAGGGAHPRAPREARTAGDLEPAPARYARVCVVRPDGARGQVTMSLHDNGRLVGATRGKTYTCWLAAPGDHQITSDADDTGPTLLRAEPGGRYYLHLEIGDLGAAHLDSVEEDAAAELMDRCEARVRVAVRGHDDHPAAMPVAAASR